MIVILFKLDVSLRSRTYFVFHLLAFCWDNLKTYLSFHIFKIFLCPLFAQPCGKPQQPFLLSNLEQIFRIHFLHQTRVFSLRQGIYFFLWCFQILTSRFYLLNSFTQSHSFRGARQDVGHSFGRMKHGSFYLLEFLLRESQVARQLIVFQYLFSDP